MVVAVDFHGLISDHRLAKHAFFRDVMHAPYSRPLLDRRQILSELELLGFDRQFYFAAMNQFLNSPHAQQPFPVAGVSEFFHATPEVWEFIVVSTAPYNRIESVAVVLSDFRLPRIKQILTTTDEARPHILAQHATRLYFDGKPDLIPAVKRCHIPVVQVSEPGYAEASPAADLTFQSWSDAQSALPTICAILHNEPIA